MNFRLTGSFPVVDYDVTDNGFLESCRMVLPGVIRTDADIRGLIADASKKLTAHGRRHSQGGQSLCADAVSLDLDRYQDVTIDDEHGTATVGAGATWDALHQALWLHGNAGGRRFAPRTHQSSAGFSVGGSLGVNCHGRDPRQGPLSESVLGLDLMMADGQTRTVRRDGTADEEALLRSVLGGYGACALILRATLSLKPERLIDLQNQTLEIEPYAQWLSQQARPNASPDPYHYAWLNCAADASLFTSVVSVIGEDVGEPEKAEAALDNESMINDDMLSVIYRAYRDAPAADRGRIWDRFTREFLISLTSSGAKRTLNLMRAPVRFAETRPHVTRGGQFEEVDLMQEYFLPVAGFAGFVEGARALLVEGQAQDTLHVLSATVRLVQADATSCMPYATAAPRACVVVNFKTRRDLAVRFQDEGCPLTRTLRALIDAALVRGGSYYLCYGRFASRAQFEAAYPLQAADGTPLRERLVNLRAALDPQHRFDNHFLRHYLG